MASPGYGKRIAPHQVRHHGADFAHLPEREAYLAAFIDRLPEGAAMDTKTLAREQPRYGQQAVASALRMLSAAGHLRRIRVNLGDGRTRWVHRTYFSRTARDDAWWARFLDEPVAPPAPAEAEARTVRPAPARPRRSEAYEALSTLGLADSRLALSARECAELEPLAAAWLELGATVPQLHAALTAGLPESVSSPGGLTRRRLVDKLPPQQLRAAPTEQPARRVMECTECRTPGRPESLPGGLCRPCHGTPPSRSHQSPQVDVRARVAHLRTLLRHV